MNACCFAVKRAYYIYLASLFKATYHFYKKRRLTSATKSIFQSRNIVLNVTIKNTICHFLLYGNLFLSF